MSTRWTEQQGRAEVRRWRRSGKSVGEYARERGIGGQRLRYWVKRVAADDGEGRAIQFVPGVVVGADGVRGRASASVGAGATVGVYLPRGVVVEAGRALELDPRWLAEVVRALEAVS